MDNLNNYGLNISLWNRKILNACWLTFVLSIAIEISLIFVTNTNPIKHMVDSIVIPSVLMFSVLIAAESAGRLFVKIHDFINIVTALALASILIWVHVSVPPIHGMLFLPFIVSMFYFSKSRVFFATIITFGAALFIYTYHPYFSDKNHYLIIVTALSMVVSGYFIAMGIVSRGIELIEDLKNISKTKQELLVKNLLMDMVSMTDALTECFNHKAFHGYMDELIERSEKIKYSLCLAIVDIDDFKQVNDTYGHWTGDLVLKSVAQTIKETIGLDDVVSRYGGEEFTLIFLDKTIEEAYSISEKIRSSIEKLVHAEMNSQTVTVSIGLNMLRSGQGKEELFKGADEALYYSKRTGKNKVTIHSDQADQQ